jgi:hypothetical protein
MNTYATVLYGHKERVEPTRRTTFSEAIPTLNSRLPQDKETEAAA